MIRNRIEIAKVVLELQKFGKRWDFRSGFVLVLDCIQLNQLVVFRGIECDCTVQ